MRSYALDHVDDSKLLTDLAGLVGRDRQNTADLLAHLAEVDARELFLPAAFPSMHAYCTGALHLDGEVAFKRIRAARFARRFPQLFEAIADGRLHVTGVVMLGPHLTEQNVDEVVAAASHRSKADLEILIARLAPRPDLPPAITPLVSSDGATGMLQLDPDPVAQHPSALDPASAPPPPARVKPLSPERFALQMTIDQATREKLERARALMRHANPSGDLAVILDAALDALLAKIEKSKFGATSRPRNPKERAADADPRYIARGVRRDVHDRDGEQCAWVSADGVRCSAKAFLEFDHTTPVAHGGQPTVDGMGLLCHAHNQYEADLKLGREFMQAKRAAAAARRAAKRASAKPAAAKPVAAVPPAAAAEPGADADAPSATERAPEASHVDSDLQLALRGLGFKADEARRAVECSARQPATTFENRLRAALATLTKSRGFRSSDGPFDLAAREYLVLADAS
jgi:hypothetical protein